MSVESTSKVPVADRGQDRGGPGCRPCSPAVGDRPGQDVAEVATELAVPAGDEDPQRPVHRSWPVDGVRRRRPDVGRTRPRLSTTGARSRSGSHQLRWSAYQADGVGQALGRRARSAPSPAPCGSWSSRAGSAGRGSGGRGRSPSATAAVRWRRARRRRSPRCWPPCRCPRCRSPPPRRAAAPARWPGSGHRRAATRAGSGSRRTAAAAGRRGPWP